MTVEDQARRRANGATWPAEFPPLAIALRSAEGAELVAGVSYETPDRRPVAYLRKGLVEIRVGAAELRRLAQLATDHERRAQGRGGA